MLAIEKRVKLLTKKLVIATIAVLSFTSCSEEEPIVKSEYIVGRWVLADGKSVPALNLHENNTYEFEISSNADKNVKGNYTYSKYVLTLKNLFDIVYVVTFKNDNEIVLDEISNTAAPDVLHLVRD
ncbi:MULTISPECIES: hypothetical protein [Sphingobacterium]|uniref:Uncharacterized protein n=1 Tax=Sphingobacterium cellulitidis TaxID=1768011 RepID=A0A8H9FX84_9SPHI|nr:MULTISPECIES: hypothetical protein [Sphingobacterium]MBA8986818.1 AAA15 family ATPase/GTPase [Sphingobacterium soli]WFB64969.1 hypothetical protein PZ892_07085 [Sphingobacterium sp. WM]GGE14189.1 hypothetical protein GCM10011516_09990 [Sphingobacterium soli]